MDADGQVGSMIIPIRKEEGLYSYLIARYNHLDIL